MAWDRSGWQGSWTSRCKEAAEYIERYFKRLPGVSAYMEDCLRQARERGFVVTLLGRRRYLPELTSPQGGARAQAERIAINTPIQGTAADLIKVAMVRLHGLIRDQGLQARMLLQVHDELLFEVARRRSRRGLRGWCANRWKMWRSFGFRSGWN